MDAVVGRDLVIFDCDGVLVDSELLASRLLAEALHPAFVLSAVVIAVAMGLALFAPRGTLEQLDQAAHERPPARGAAPPAAFPAPRPKRGR